MKKSLFTHYSLAVSLVSLLPVIVFAQTAIDTIVSTTLRTTLNFVIGILFVIATLVFLWGVIQFIAKSGDEAGRAKAKGIMTWGIIGLAVMAAAWGIVTLIESYFTIPGRGIPRAPGTLQ